MAYAEPNVAVFPTLHMPVHSKGDWHDKYSIHKCTCRIDRHSIKTATHTHTETHRSAVLISKVGVLKAGRAPAAVFGSQRSHLSAENN